MFGGRPGSGGLLGDDHGGSGGGDDSDGGGGGQEGGPAVVRMRGSRAAHEPAKGRQSERERRRKGEN